MLLAWACEVMFCSHFKQEASARMEAQRFMSAIWVRAVHTYCSPRTKSSYCMNLKLAGAELMSAGMWMVHFHWTKTDNNVSMSLKILGISLMSARWRGTEAKRTACTPPRPTCIDDFHLLHPDLVNFFFLNSRIKSVDPCAQNLNLYLKSVVISENRIPRRQWCIVQGVENGSLWTILLFDTEVSTCR
jgi:hypothetical protein